MSDRTPRARRAHSDGIRSARGGVVARGSRACADRGTPALIAPDTSTWAESLTGIVLLGALETANGLDDESFDNMATHGAAPLLLQNDVWGLWQRTSSEGSVSSIREELHLAAEGLMRRLAAPANVAPNRTAIPAAIAPHFVGFEPEESETPILQHEFAYDARRVFHIAIRGEQREERALYSTLIGVGPDRPSLRDRCRCGARNAALRRRRPCSRARLRDSPRSAWVDPRRWLPSGGRGSRTGSKPRGEPHRRAVRRTDRAG
jgi:hypothetical protein